MIVAILLPFLSAFFLGLLVVHIIEIYFLKQGLSLLLKLSLSFGIGIGFSGLTLFAALIGFGFLSRELVLISDIFLILLFFLFFIRKKYQTSDYLKKEIFKPAIDRDEKTNFLKVLFIIILSFTAITFIINSLKEPYGGWDAWAKWNMRARFLYRAGIYWRDGFRYYNYTHMPLCYPPIFSLIIARGWFYLTQETFSVPILIAFIFTFSIPLLLYASLRQLIGKRVAFLAAIMLLLTPDFIVQGVSQYADVPLSFYFLGVLVMLNFYEKSNHFAYFMLAALLLGISILIKLEGIIFFYALILSRALVVTRLKGLRKYLKELANILLILSPFLILLFYFKINIGDFNKVYSWDLEMLISKLTDPSRYYLIIKEFFKTSLYFGRGVIWVMILCFCILWKKRKYKDNGRILTSVTVLLSIYAVYFLVYILSPFDLKWHLESSMERIFMQFWPSTIFVFSQFLVEAEDEK